MTEKNDASHEDSGKPEISPKKSGRGKAKIKIEVEFELDDETVFKLDRGGIKTTTVVEN